MVDRVVTRLAIATAAAALAASAGAGFAAGAVRAAGPHPALLTGEYWGQLRPGERQIYLSGFIAGAAAEQARARAAAAGREGDSLAVSSRAVEQMRAEKTLRFRFAPSVYSAQIDDFYWWKNHAGTPIMDVVIHFNDEMLGQQLKHGEAGKP